MVIGLARSCVCDGRLALVRALCELLRRWAALLPVQLT